MFNQRSQVLWLLVLLLIGLFGFAIVNQIYYIIDAITMSTAKTALQLPVAHNITDIKPINMSNSCLIPQVVHQIWKTKDVSTYPINASHDDWKRSSLYENYTVKLWSDYDLEELIRLKYPFLYSTYQSYSKPIQRADIARLAVLHSEGGIYADLDVHPGNTSIEKLLNYQFVAPGTNNFHVITNHFLMAEKNSPLLEYLLVKSVERAKASIWINYLRVFWTTGPFFVTEMVNEYCALNPGYNGLILDDWLVNDFIWHDVGRSWHDADGLFLNYAADHFEFVKRFIFGLFLFVAVIGMYVLCRQLVRYHGNSRMSREYTILPSIKS
jgi:mannosyltransferase OCH1-like enzyme